MYECGLGVVCLVAVSVAPAETDIVGHFRKQYEIVGSVLSVDTAQKTCTIDRGERHGLAVNGELVVVREDLRLFVAKGKVVEIRDDECMAACSQYFIPPRKGDLVFMKAGATVRRLEQLRETLAALWTEDSQLLVQQHAPEHWKTIEKARQTAETDAPVTNRVKAIERAILSAREGIALAGNAQRKAQVDVLKQEWARTWTESASAKVKRFRAEDWQSVEGAVERASKAETDENFELASEEYKYALELAGRAIAKADEIHAIEEKTADDLLKRQAAIALWNRVDGAREDLDNSLRAMESGRADAVHVKKALQHAAGIRKEAMGATGKKILTAEETTEATRLLDTAVTKMRDALASRKAAFDKVWTEKNAALVRQRAPETAAEIEAAVRLAVGVEDDVDRAFAYSRATMSVNLAIEEARRLHLLAEVTAVRKQILDMWTTNRQQQVRQFLPDALPDITNVLGRADRALGQDQAEEARRDYAYALRLVHEAVGKAEEIQAIEKKTADDLLKRQAAVALRKRVGVVQGDLESSLRDMESGRADAVRVRKALEQAALLRKEVTGAGEKKILSSGETTDATRLLDTAVSKMRDALEARKTAFNKVWTGEDVTLVREQAPESATEIEAAARLAAGTEDEVDRAFAYSRATESANLAIGKARRSRLLAEAATVRKQVLDSWTADRRQQVEQFLPGPLSNITNVLQQAARAFEQNQAEKARSDYTYALHLVREAIRRADELKKITDTTNVVVDTSEAELTTLIDLAIAPDITPESFLEEVRNRIRQFDAKLRKIDSKGAVDTSRRRTFWRAMARDAHQRKHFGVVRGAMVAAWSLYADPLKELPSHWGIPYNALLGIEREAPGYRCRIDTARNPYLDSLPAGAANGPVKAGTLPHRLSVEVEHGRLSRRLDFVLVPDGSARLDKMEEPSYRQYQPFYIAVIETDVGAVRCYREGALEALRRQEALKRYFNAKMDAVSYRGRPSELPYWRADADAALGFCNWLNHLHGLRPVYTKTTDGKWVRTGNGTGFRLPSNREWEYASRYGFDWFPEQGRQSWAGMKSGRLQELRRVGVADSSFDLVWFNRRGKEPRISSEARATPYPLGMFDMCGNTAELGTNDDTGGESDLQLVLCGGQCKDSSPLGVMPWWHKDYSELALSESFVGFRVILPVVVHDLQ